VTDLAWATMANSGEKLVEKILITAKKDLISEIGDLCQGMKVRWQFEPVRADGLDKL